MKILLVGEYSRLHNSLKEGLTALGHEAVIVGTGDNFKKFHVDYSIYPSFVLKYRLFRKIKNGLYLLTGLDLENTERGIRFYRLLPKLKGFDHVQLINSDAVETHPFLSLWLYKRLFRQNGTASLLVCGDETPVIDCYLNGDMKYSILTPYLENPQLKPQFSYSLKYVTESYRKVFDWIKNNSNNSNIIITADLDYKIPLAKMGIAASHIPNPVNTDTLHYIPSAVEDKVIIFLGINRLSYVKKGIRYFEEALEIIRQKYPDKAEIIITENVPYNQYITLYQKAHIVLDQVYAYDQGYNALEAMAQGKVVFTGAETAFEDYYGLTEKVAVNALPDSKAIADELGSLIENPYEIIAISERARHFIEKEHHYIRIAERYIEVWNR